MPNRTTIPQQKKDQSIIRWIILSLATLGLLDSIYLLIYKLTGANQMCLGNGGCHDVNFSIYSEIGGIPVSVFGILAFLVIALLVLLENKNKVINENSPLLVFAISLAGVAFTAYLTWLEVAVIKAICPFCVTVAVIILFIFILAVNRLVKQTLL
jgi:uncharacterized membrane protein